MSELLSKINTNTGLIFSLKDQIDVSNTFLQQEITDLQNEKQKTIEVSETFIEKAIETWSANITDGGRSRPHGMIWSGEKGLFVSANVLTGGGVFPISTSTDGLNWVGRQILDSSGDVYTGWTFGRSVAWSKELNLFVAVSIDTLSEILPERKQIATSTDGLIWTILDQTFNRQYIDVVWAKELGLFVAVSSSLDTTNQVLISADGLNWVQQNIPSDLGGYQSVCWSPELGLLVAVRTGVLGVATSTNGINWTPRTTPNNGHFQIDWSPSLRLFAVCSVGTGNPLPVPQPPINSKIMISSDGINWTYQTTPNNLGHRGIVWCSNLGYFVSATTANGFFNNKLIYSKDGVNWSEITLPNRWTNRCICYSNDLGLIVIGQDSNTLSNFLTSSLQGRPPTSYNVFDSDFNRIDQEGSWAIKAKELYSQGVLKLDTPNTQLTGGIQFSSSFKTENYTLQTGDYAISLTNQNVATLPLIDETNVGKEYVITNVGTSNFCSIASSGEQFIFTGSPVLTTTTSISQKATIRLLAIRIEDGFAWTI